MQPKKYHIRNYKSGDEESIVTLFGLVFKIPMTLQQWRWKYGGDGVKTVYSMVATDDSDTIVGHAGAIPLRGHYRGEKRPVFQICDVMIHPQARGYNLFALLLRELLTAIVEGHPRAFCYGFPGRRPFLLGQRVRVYDQIELAVETLLRPARAAFTLLATGILDWHSPQLDQLWMRLASQYRLTLIRDGRYLCWRYAEHPVHAYRLIGLYLINRLIGWAVIREDRDRLLIVDLLIPRRWLGPSLHALNKLAGERTIQIWLPRGWREVARGDQHTIPVVTTNMIWGLGFDTAEVRDSLYYTMGDVDIF